VRTRADSLLAQFILITWIGQDVRVLRKAKLSVHAADVKRVLSVYSLEVPANSLDDLAEVRPAFLSVFSDAVLLGVKLTEPLLDPQEPIVVRLRKAGGASYDRA